jgi:hypothetical protein
MASVRTATFVKDVSEFFTGAAALYELVPPFQRSDLDPNGQPYIEVIQYVVAADALLLGVLVGTTLYQTDETGYVTSWDRLHHTAIADSAHQAFRHIGYEEVKPDGEQG